VMQNPINGPAVLQELLSTDDLQLRAAPLTLAVRLPQFMLLETRDGDGWGDDDFWQWIQPEDADDYREVTWKDGLVDLRACCAPGCVGAEDAVYRLRACVHYCNRGDVPGPGVTDEGHFTASFREGETWYGMDDLDPEAVVRAKLRCPTEYPYICFLERVGEPEVQLESLCSHQVVAVIDWAESAEEGERAAGDSARNDADDIPAKRVRLRGKQAPGPYTTAGPQTPAKRTMLSREIAVRKKKRLDARNRSGHGQAQDRSGHGQAQDRRAAP
jgi:hypothetical protein